MMEGLAPAGSFLIGGSMGGIAVFRAAETALEGVEGIVSISTPQFPSQYYPAEGARERRHGESAPGDPDAEAVHRGRRRLPAHRSGGDPVRGRAQSIADAVAGDVEVLIVDSAAHSSKLVTTAEPPGGRGQPRSDPALPPRACLTTALDGVQVFAPREGTSQPEISHRERPYWLGRACLSRNLPGGWSHVSGFRAGLEGIFGLACPEMTFLPAR
jgi:pimeloyl-ACP methyl ester carboxylesterase